MLPFEVATICLSTCVPIKKRHKRLYQPRNEEKICSLDIQYERAPGEPKGGHAFLNFKFYKIIHKYALKTSKN